ncbi:hypothetical protein Lgra_2129 [Legionella gratiana]|uniref:Uncharacterized protein n=1 Tax=Legionella gratiana TaxID=45066 RepID=A0A378J9S3_9GAMM|nr:hypothetical protein [Legionella gratiana]KTD11163.1 hypothetical protein Lgra_2129 [Legionella gratiana]STX44355.1 Uncharacterised protein [Legionella gratiana]
MSKYTNERDRFLNDLNKIITDLLSEHEKLAHKNGKNHRDQTSLNIVTDLIDALADRVHKHIGSKQDSKSDFISLKHEDILNAAQLTQERLNVCRGKQEQSKFNQECIKIPLVEERNGVQTLNHYTVHPDFVPNKISVQNPVKKLSSIEVLSELQKQIKNKKINEEVLVPCIKKFQQDSNDIINGSKQHLAEDKGFSAFIKKLFDALANLFNKPPEEKINKQITNIMKHELMSIKEKNKPIQPEPYAPRR